ncbi:Pentatricopeptide repeat-containing protein At4g14170 [Linum perenne]
MSNKFLFSTIHHLPTEPADASVVSSYFPLLHSSPHPTHLRHLHARLLRTFLYHNVILSSKLVLMYSRLGKLNPHALSTFFHMPSRNIFSWNIVIGEFSRSNMPEKSIELFLRMWRGAEARPDDYSLPLVLRACAGSGSVGFGVLLHGLCVKMGLVVNIFVASALVFMYVNLGRMSNARKVFDEMSERDAVLWTSMLAGYSQKGESVLGLKLLREMVDSEVGLDGVVMVSVLTMCSQLGWLKQGKTIHAWCLRKCVRMELSLANAIVDMYVKCFKLTYAQLTFDVLGAVLGSCRVHNNVEVGERIAKKLIRLKPEKAGYYVLLSNMYATSGRFEDAQVVRELMKNKNVAKVPGVSF